MTKSLYLVIAISLVITGYIGVRSYLTPQTANIMEIAPVNIQYGHTTVTGTIQKNSASSYGIVSYTLMLRDLRAIKLDVQDLDSLVGAEVQVTGELSPPPVANYPMTMTVSEIKLK